MNVKPSEIRAASKAGRVAINEIKKKQQLMLKKKQQSQIKMDKIRAEIEAIKEKERNISGEGSDNKVISKQPIRNKASSIKNVTNQENNEIIPRLTMEKRRYDVKMHQLNINHELESYTSPSAKVTSNIEEKQSSITVSSSLINAKGQDMLHSKSRSMAFVRRGSVIAITKASSPDQSQLAKRDKLEEGRCHFEEGHRLCWRLQDSHSALGEYRKALFIREGILGKYHEDTGKIYYWVGQSLVKLKEYEEAIVAFSRALRIFDRVLARNHKYQKWTGTAIAAAFHEMDDPDDYTLYKTALDNSISHEVKGDNFTKNKLFSQAISEYRAAIKCIIVQDNHPDSADLHSKIAIILRRMGELDKALQENHFALEIYDSSLGPEHPETVKTLNRTIEKKRTNQLSLALLEKLDFEK